MFIPGKKNIADTIKILTVTESDRYIGVLFGYKLDYDIQIHNCVNDINVIGILIRIIEFLNINMFLYYLNIFFFLYWNIAIVCGVLCLNDNQWF